MLSAWNIFMSTPALKIVISSLDGNIKNHFLHQSAWGETEFQIKKYEWVRFGGSSKIPATQEVEIERIMVGGQQG
jgi:hypothetical protein